MNNLLKQKKFKNKRFCYDQFWKISFRLIDATQNYISVIKARSLEEAIKVLSLKLRHEGLILSDESIECEMFHKDYEFKNHTDNSFRKINILDWENIHACSFPNENNHLFKYTVK